MKHNWAFIQRLSKQGEPKRLSLKRLLMSICHTEKKEPWHVSIVRASGAIEI